MARSASDMAEQLIEIYSKRKKRYFMSKDDFKKIAGKTNLKEAYLQDVASELHKRRYLLLDLLNEKDIIGVIKIKSIIKRWIKLQPDIIEEYKFDDRDEDD